MSRTPVVQLRLRWHSEWLLFILLAELLEILDAFRGEVLHLRVELRHAPRWAESFARRAVMEPSGTLVMIFH